MADGRFATVGEEELNKILLEKDSRRNTASAVKLFKSYLNTKFVMTHLKKWMQLL
jgi:hypothetical protein